MRAKKDKDVKSALNVQKLANEVQAYNLFLEEFFLA